MAIIHKEVSVKDNNYIHDIWICLTIEQYTDDQDQHSSVEVHTIEFQFVTIYQTQQSIQPAGERDHHYV